ncbi:MAG TPA: family 20 glycosylhydrolase [Polyangiaceae bacterium]|nr:family 20 glycosylhydrolase [Polyangiaceae bacterium]
MSSNRRCVSPVAWSMLGCSWLWMGTPGCSPDASEEPGCVGSACGAPLTQASLDALAAALELRLTILENVPDDCVEEARLGYCHDARLTLVNRGAASDVRGWSLYWTNQHPVLRVEPGELRLSHINGSLHAIEPARTFAGFAASESKELTFQADGCWLAESDGMPRAYLAAPGLTPAPIVNTDTEDASGWLAPLVDPEQTECEGLVGGELASAATRFDANQSLADLGADAVMREVIPRPLDAAPGSGERDLSGGVSLQAPALDPATLATVSERLRRLGVSESPGGRPLLVSIDATDPAFAGRSSTQAYRLGTGSGSGDEPISIVGGDAAGAFYGLQTLLALVRAEPGESPRLPELTVRYDAPRYAYRGLQLDVSRNFQPPAVVARVLEQMAAYKLDALHFHLSDDEGFRLEIPGLPELTEVGSRRCHDLEEHTCLLPQLGSGPTADTSGSGHYTRDEFVALLRLATALHIQVIPEFDMPAHAHAMVRGLAERARNGDPSFLLHDPEDTSEYRSVQGYTDNAVNACLESAYAFVARLMDEVGAMYRDAGAPLSVWHIGADEVPAGAWTSSPACEARFEPGGELESAGDLQAYFLRRVNALAQQRGLGVRMWGDGVARSTFDADAPHSIPLLDPATDLSGNDVSVNWYSALRFFDDAPGPLTAAGYKVVLGSADYLYIDNTPEADPKERGSYWSTRFLDARKMFSFLPGNLAANVQLSRDCEAGACDYFFGAPTPITRPENVIGVESAQWSETVRDAEQLEAMLFPRLLAVAERAWHRAAWEPADGMDAAAPIDRDALDADWQRFANVLGYKELPGLERAGLRHRVEVPGARIRAGVLEVNAPLPGLTLEYEAADGRFVAYDPLAPPALVATRVRAVTPGGRAGRAIPVTSE